MVATAQATPYKLYLAGEWSDSDSGKTFEVVNPATLETIATVPDAGRSDMQRALDAAARAQPEWAQRPASDRHKILKAAAALMIERTDHIARLMTSEQGKPVTESRTEVAYAASFIDWFAEEARRVYGETIPANTPDKRIMVLRRPVGVTAAITPWNFPAAMITRKLGPALATGCAQVIKPSELTPLTALEIARVFDEVGLPKGLLSVVCGTDPAAITSAIMEDERVRLISFTGSTEVGKLLMKAAADTMKKVSLELGGHAPFIVFEDADIDAAVTNCVAAKMRNMGQTCVAANRIFVQRSVVDEFASKLTDKIRALKVGNGLDESVSVGPLVDEPTFQKVESHVRDAREKGGRVVLGGERAEAGNGYFFQPTVILDANDSMLLAHDETFGPVAAILPFETEDEVVRRANDTKYGLATYFFTRDIGRVWRLAEQLEYGILGANDGMPSTAQAPFGGVKESGIGREGGKEGIEEFLDVKFISLGGIAPT